MQTLPACSHSIASEGSDYKPPPEPEFLADCSPRDQPWDVHREQADDVSGIYASAPEFLKVAGRMSMCSGVLGFAWKPERDDPTIQSLRLRVARFCRVRSCPVCQWRRSLMWKARFYEAIPAIQAVHPKARFLFLTLTCRNVPIDDLRLSLGEMNRAWHRLVKRSGFEIVLGWIRTTEVTRAEGGAAHPHFHVLMMVPPSYFKGGNYLSQAEWTKLWAEALRAEYAPIVDIRAVKGELGDAVKETLKYSVKPSDMVADPEWFLEYHRQVHKLRFLASGGVLKDVLREAEASNDDLLLFGDEAEKQEAPSVFFGWAQQVRRYRRMAGCAV